MSPARRLFLVLLAAALAAVVAVAVVVHVVTRPARAPTASGVAQDRPGTVLLVPGYGGSTASIQVLADRLRDAGREAVVVPLPGDGTGDLQTYVPVLASAVAEAIAAGSPSVDVIGYSAGGVVVRLWEAAGGAAVTRRVITLGSPHHGTGLASLGAQLVPAVCPQACRQLVPGSALLDQLNRGDETPDGPAWMSLWTSVDKTVTPPDSARLAGAVDVVLQDVCPGATTSHSDLPRDPAVQAIVLQALSAAPADGADQLPGLTR